MLFDRDRVEELHLFALFGLHTFDDVRIFFVDDQRMDTGEHLLEVLLQTREIVRVADHFEQIFVADEIESKSNRCVFWDSIDDDGTLPWERSTLPFEIFAERFLDLRQRISETFEELLNVGDGDDVHHERRFLHFLQ